MSKKVGSLPKRGRSAAVKQDPPQKLAEELEDDYQVVVSSSKLSSKTSLKTTELSKTRYKDGQRVVVEEGGGDTKVQELKVILNAVAVNTKTAFQEPDTVIADGEATSTKRSRKRPSKGSKRKVALKTAVGNSSGRRLGRPKRNEKKV